MCYLIVSIPDLCTLAYFNQYRAGLVYVFSGFMAESTYKAQR